MTTDLDIYRSAHAMIQQHGDGAAFQAAVKADKMLDNGNLDGASMWRQILTAINELLRSIPGASDPVH